MKPKNTFISALLALVLAGAFAIAASAEDARQQNVPAEWKRALVLARDGKLAEAEQPLNDLLAQTNHPDWTPHLLTFRAYLRGEGGHFQEAVTDLKQVIESDPSEHLPWYLLTPLLIQSGEITDYQAHCKAMLDRFCKTTDAPTAEMTAKSCLLLPYAVGPEDLALAARVAKNAVTLSKKGDHLHWRLMTGGLAEYRQGHFDGAIEKTQLAQKELISAHDGGRDMCEADTYLISAMAHQKLKQPSEARAAFARARRIVKTRSPKLDSKDLGPAWYDVLMTYTLMNEAEDTVEGPPAAGQK
jgi:tetratricopeptide (TPR) repeat protein